LVHQGEWEKKDELWCGQVLEESSGEETLVWEKTAMVMSVGDTV
jgi:hypothetical protein